MVRWPSGKARVCKTLIRGFDSHPHLIFLPKKVYFIVTHSVKYLGLRPFAGHDSSLTPSKIKKLV